MEFCDVCCGLGFSWSRFFSSEGRTNMKQVHRLAIFTVNTWKKPESDQTQVFELHSNMCGFYTGVTLCVSAT